MNANVHSNAVYYAKMAANTAIHKEVGRIKYFPREFISKGGYGCVYKGEFLTVMQLLLS